MKQPGPKGVVAVYLRISMDRTGQQLAIGRQRQAAEEIVRAHRLGDHEVRFYAETTSATKRRGPDSQYARLVADAEAGRVAVLIVWDLDRLTRIPREMEEWLELCEKGLLRIVTADGEIDTRSDNGRLFIRIKAAVARAEVERKAARQRLAHDQRRAAGKPWFARRPFGYEKDGGLREVEARALTRVYADFAAGDHNLTHHADRLNAKGLTGTSGAPWNGSSLRQVLLADRNLGGPQWAATVDEDTFHRVRRVLRDPKRLAGGRAPIAQLTGIAVCDRCDGHVGVGHLSSAPREGGYYICTKSRHVAHPRSLVDDWVDELVVESMADPQVRAQWAEEPAELHVPYDELDRIDVRLEEVAEDYGQDAMTRDQFLRATAALRARRGEVLEEIAFATSGSPVSGLGDRDPAVWWAGLGLHDRRAVLRRLEVRLRYRGRGNRSWCGERDVYARWRAAVR